MYIKNNKKIVSGHKKLVWGDLTRENKILITEIYNIYTFIQDIS